MIGRVGLSLCSLDHDFWFSSKRRTVQYCERNKYSSDKMNLARQQGNLESFYDVSPPDAIHA